MMEKGAAAMAQRLLHGVIDAKILEATLSVSTAADGQPKPAASKSQNLWGKVLSLIKQLSLICYCQRFEKLTGLGSQHAAGKRLYATIGMDTACVCQTRAVDAANDPQWKEPFHIYCAHNASDVVFTVFMADVNPTGAFDALVVGHAYLPVDDIVGGQQVDCWLPICDEKRKPLEGLDKIHVQLRFSDVSADPESRWGKGIYGSGVPYPGVPRTFFGQHRGCRVTLYQDAHAAPTSGRSRCWVDVFDAITNARRLVYIAGWSVNTDVALVRDPRRPAQTLGQLLKKKAGEHVTVLMLVSDTHGMDTASYFRGTGVHCVLCPRNNAAEAGAMFTHHQKAVVVDGPRGLVCFLGGIDLCGGRYDTQEHPVFRTLGTTHRDDFHQPSFPGASIRKGGPREPWHDVHCRIEGLAAWDVLDNFEQRWRKQGGGDNNPQLVQLLKSSAAREVADQDADSWNVQVFRSIDSNAVVGFPENPDEATQCGLVVGLDHASVVERSIQDAYIHAIRRAKSFIYIESHNFLGSSHGWHRDDVNSATTSVENAVDELHLIPMELSLKITSKIKAGDSFRVYVVVPMWPEGVPESEAVQAILHWQRRTMEMMYKDVAMALSARGLTNNPKDFLSFFCLGNRESYSASEYAPPEQPELDSDYSRAQRARRFKINVHANTMIVDDEYIIVGSANINQRSMDGGRDTEMAMGAYQPRHLHTPSVWPRGQVHSFRLALWREHLGQAATQAAGDDLLYPVRPSCMNKVNQAARQHWDLYASDAFRGDLPGHLMAYPVGVGDRGTLQETVACFPDTKARVFGSSSVNLPPILTT